MKKILLSISLLALCGLFMMSCGGGGGSDDPTEMTEQQIAAKALKDGSPWAVASVDSKPDGSDAEALAGLKLTFNITGSGTDTAPGSFSSTGVEGLESDPGATWSWSGGGTSTITLNNGFAAELTDVEFTPGIESPTSVQVTFNVTSIGGRGKGLGEYTVTLE